MSAHPPTTTIRPAAPLPFCGLGLDAAEVRRKVSDLVLLPILREEEQVQDPHFDAPPALSGYSLLLRLCRETLGS